MSTNSSNDCFNLLTNWFHVTATPEQTEFKINSINWCLGHKHAELGTWYKFTKTLLSAERWFLLITVSMLLVANCAHWISYGSVNSKCAVFYQRSTEEITRIITVSYAIGVPFCLVATYIVTKCGLRTVVFTGGLLTFIGGLMCCLATFPGWSLKSNLIQVNPSVKC